MKTRTEIYENTIDYINTIASIQSLRDMLIQAIDNSPCDILDDLYNDFHDKINVGL